MKAVRSYKVVVYVYESGDICHSRVVTFSDRRKAMSYYKSALTYWSPSDCCYIDQSVELVDVTFGIMYEDSSVECPFSKHFTF